MRYAIWLPGGEIVSVRFYDAGSGMAIIEHNDGRWETVSAGKIRLLEYPDNAKADPSAD